MKIAPSLQLLGVFLIGLIVVEGILIGLVVSSEKAVGTPDVIYVGHSDFISNAAFSPDGKEVAAESLDKTVPLWKLGLP